MEEVAVRSRQKERATRPLYVLGDDQMPPFELEQRNI